MSNPKSKTQKKLDNAIRIALTEVCEQALDEVAGFQWLTHRANYSDFPGSLIITCVFEDDTQLLLAESRGDDKQLRQTIQHKLLKIGVKFKSINRQVAFDSEESCDREHAGDWQQRLIKH